MSTPVAAQAQQTPDEEPLDPTTAPAPKKLPDHIETPLSVFGPGDADLLAGLLEQNPQYKEAIIDEVAGRLGNAIVTQALEILAKKQQPADPVSAKEPAPPPPPPPEVVATAAPAPAPEKFDYSLSPLMAVGDFKATVREHVDFIRAHPELRELVLAGAAAYQPDPNVAPAVRKALESPPNMAEETEAPAPAVVEKTVEETKQAPDAAPQKTEDGWVVRARVYNEEHREHAQEFLELIGYEVVLGHDGELDPSKVAVAQQGLGVEADGKVGPHTLGAARALAKSAGKTGHQAEVDQLAPDDMKRTELE